jgi:hypothetical protein
MGNRIIKYTSLHNIGLSIIILTASFIFSACTNSQKSHQMKLFKIFKMKKNTELKDIEIKYDLSASNANNLKEIEIGNINLPTGKIIVSDPFFTHSTAPFARTVAPGNYPVKLYITEVEPDHFRIAFAKIKFKPENASRWILAITEDIDINDFKNLEDDDYFGFPVEAGLGCFIDAKTNKEYEVKIDAFYENNPDKNYYDNLLADEFSKYSSGNEFSSDIGDWNNHIINKSTSSNVIMFSSGWGDGYYPTYWGYNDNNETVELTIDFMLYDENEGE